MSTYNLAEYNQARFNIEQDKIPRLKANMVERVTSVTAYGAGYMFKSVLSERVTAEAEVAKGFLMAGSGRESVTQEASGNRYFKMAVGGFEDLQHKGNIAGIYSSKGAMAEALSMAGFISGFFRSDVSLSENVDQAVSIAQKVRIPNDMSETVDVIADVEATDEQVCSLNITIKPGQTLIVDAANYNIFLDGENVVHTHSGDWIDEMNRMTQSIKITGTRSSNLAASILFTERFL